MKTVLNWLAKVPHLFGKIMVVVCVAGGSASIVWSFRILSRTDNDPSATLTAALAFFGGELLAMAGKSAFSKNKRQTETNIEEEEEV